MQESTAGSQRLLVLDKIVKILDAFTLEQPALSLSELRERTGLPTSTLQRLVANLVAHEFLDRRDNILRISPRMSYWAAPASRGAELVDLVAPVLASLRDQSGETVAFFRASRGYRVCVGLAETRHAVRRSMRVGQVLPLDSGSASHVMLAAKPALLNEALARAAGERASEEGHLDEPALRRAISRAKSQGWAVTAEEREAGTCGVSAPVFDAQADLVGAITLLGPTQRITADMLQSYVPSVVAAAETATRVLGGRLPAEH